MYTASHVPANTTQVCQYTCTACAHGQPACLLPNCGYHAIAGASGAMICHHMLHEPRVTQGTCSRTLYRLAVQKDLKSFLYVPKPGVTGTAKDNIWKRLRSWYRKDVISSYIVFEKAKCTVLFP